jgi:hypothetical protein
VRDGTTPAAAVRGLFPALAALFVASAMAFVTARRLGSEAMLRHAPALALVLLTVFWIYLFATTFVRIPLVIGYDAKAHVDYIVYLLRTGSLPPPTQGFSTYHPPLFYAVAAAAAAVLAPVAGGPTTPWVLKLVPLLSGLGLVWVTHALARRVLAGDALARLLAVVVAGVLPLNLYMAAYVTNEPLHAVLTAASLLAAARVLAEDRPTVAGCTTLAVLLGLTLLTKYTGLLVAAVVLAVVAVKLLAADRVGVGRVAAIVGGIAAGVTGIAGWAYARNWVHTGNPLYTNLDHPSGISYWQPPGFRTAGYYLGFGESLRHPFFSAFHSLWDGLYSTVWGEGTPPGVRLLSERHDLWNYDFMSASYLLALPATVIVAVGIGRAIVASFTDRDPARRWIFTLLVLLPYAALSSLLLVSMRYPFWGGARASYVLSLVAPLAVCTGLGFSTVDRWLQARGGVVLRAALYGWLGTFIAALALTFGG